MPSEDASYVCETENLTKDPTNLFSKDVVSYYATDKGMESVGLRRTKDGKITSLPVRKIKSDGDVLLNYLNEVYALLDKVQKGVETSGMDELHEGYEARLALRRANKELDDVFNRIQDHSLGRNKK